MFSWHDSLFLQARGEASGDNEAINNADVEDMMEIHSSYGLSATKFNSLFAEDSSQIDKSALDDLAKGACSGNKNSIDLLHNIALRTDGIGKRAESILFDLFSGKTPANPGVAKDIQAASLTLYELKSTAQGKPIAQEQKLSQPSPLLYMAGAAAEPGSQYRAEIKNLFERVSGQSQDREAQVGESDDVWGTNRYVMDDELAMTVKTLELKEDPRLSFNKPMLIDFFVDMFVEKVADSGDNPLKSREYFPINVGGHWMLLGVYEVDNVKKAVLFNSQPELIDTQNANAQIGEAVSRVGVLPENFVKIEINLQEHVPNGCGLFVNAAMQHLAEHPEQDPAEALACFVSLLPDNEADLAQFNINQRRQLYGAWLASQATS